jgi:hypothetical protein
VTKATLPGELAAEISRVTKIREQTEQAGALLGRRANVMPMLLMIDASLKAAIAAAGSPDIVGQIAAVQDLREYQS